MKSKTTKFARQPAPLRSVQPQRLNRRVFLRGSLYGVSISVGLPLLDIMLDGNGTRLAHGAPIPKRFGVFHWGGGIAHPFWVPQTRGPDWTPPLSLTPFAGKLKPYTTVVSGFNHPGSSPGHIPARGIALSSSHDLTTGLGGVGTYRGQTMPEPSVDALVAEHWANATRFELLAVRVCDKGPYRSNSSWKRGGRTYNRHDVDPTVVWNRIFSGALPAAPGAPPSPTITDVTAPYKKSMLDVLVAESKALKAKLGRVDQQRLDQHLEGLSSLEKQLQAPAPSGGVGPGCAKPAVEPVMDKSSRAKLHAEVLAAALACDLTRIFSFEWSANQSQETYPEVGLNREHHDFTHGGARTEQHGKVIQFIMQHYAYLGEMLMDKAEGTGNVLDNTIVVGTSEHADAGSHNWVDHPFLLLGKAGGSLKAGQHFRGSGNEAPRVLLTAVRAAGVDVTKIGHNNRTATAPITDLLT